MPPVYGYKTTAKKKVEEKNCVGNPYKVWRKWFFLGIVKNTPRLRTLLGHYRWSGILCTKKGYRGTTTPENHVEVLTVALGREHPITTLYRKSQEGADWVKAWVLKRNIHGTSWRSILDRMITMTQERKPKSEMTLAGIFKRYPLLDTEDTSLRVLWSQDAKKWITYIKMVDDQLA